MYEFYISNVKLKRIAAYVFALYFFKKQKNRNRGGGGDSLSDLFMSSIKCDHIIDFI